MSIAEFIDGMPSHDERNFSRFQSQSELGQIKRIPAYISTEERPSDQIIVNDKANFSLRYIHTNCGKNNGDRKRQLDETTEDNQEVGPSVRKCPRVE